MEPIQPRRVATILAIGTANPINIFPQAEHPEFYFRATNNQHMTQLKHKFKRIPEKSTIGKRHLHLTEEILKENPNMSTLYAPSLDARQAILINEVPKLGSEAALKAMEEWGQPPSKITHLIFATSSGIGMPGADFKLAQLIGLDPCVQTIMIYQQGCLAGGAAVRIAKDVAENNAGSCVLIVCSEITSVMCHHAPSDDYLDALVGSAIFSDGAAALVVCADPDATKLERPIFQIVSTSQKIIPDSDTTVVAHIREMGLQYYISKGVLEKIESIAVKFFSETFTDEYGVSDWNSLFHIVHPGGPSILTAMEEKLGLEKKKLRASRHVLSEHGNMWSPSVLFVLDEMRRNSIEEGKSTTGEGLDLGVLLSFGPGLTVEIAVLRSVPI